MSILLFISIGLLTYYVSHRKIVEEVHLSADIAARHTAAGPQTFNFVSILMLPIIFIERLFSRLRIVLPAGNLQKRLIQANRIMSPTQFTAVKLFFAAALPAVVFIIMRPELPILVIPLAIGFILPEMWLNGKIKKRSALIVKDLPLVIDLLNICVGGGLDFMVAVNRVILEFRPCVLIDEMKIMLQEMQVGSSRREALKSMANRINNPEIYSFVRTLLQADRIGTSIGDALKIQSEEIRTRWFQRGEESALKAPIKLLFPLMIFILPVVLIIVAGPILIQFTKGGMVKF